MSCHIYDGLIFVELLTATQRELHNLSRSNPTKDPRPPMGVRIPIGVPKPATVLQGFNWQLMVLGTQESSLNACPPKTRKKVIVVVVSCIYMSTYMQTEINVPRTQTHGLPPLILPSLAFQASHGRGWATHWSRRATSFAPGWFVMFIWKRGYR